MTGYLSRELTPRLLRAMKQLPVVVLSGLRQAGKSTLLQNEEVLSQGHTYRTLDDFPTLAAAQSNPESLLQSDSIFDEVQRCPEPPKSPLATSQSAASIHMVNLVQA